MLNTGNYNFIILLTYLFFSSMPIFAQGVGKIKGKIVDAISGDPLPGANVFVPGTSIGGASDFEGNFMVNNVPIGERNIKISYLGYKSKTQLVIIESGRTTFFEVKLDLDVIEGEEVVVSVQARGQREAINQQISANSIKNVVSETKIQELPEANAAEAVGRLPGVSLQREGGEGNKVIIRGLSPKYNKVQVEGTSMAGTDQNDRSTDLSAISSFMLGGIEVYKTALANQEADQLGGTVNFKLKEAPDDPTLMVLAQGGYNGLRNEVKDYKFVLNGSKRFFDGKFGVFANIDVERKNRSSQTANSTYSYHNSDSVAFVSNLNLQDNERIKNRYGGTIVLDYRLPSTKIKLFSMLNHSTIAQNSLQQNVGFSTTLHRYSGIRSELELTNMSNSFSFEHFFDNVKLYGKVSYSFADNNMPNQLIMNANQIWNTEGFNALRSNPLEDRRGFLVDSTSGYLHPNELIKIVNTDPSSAYVNEIRRQNAEIHEDRLSIKFGAEIETDFGGDISLITEFGGMYKKQNRAYDFEGWVHNFGYSPGDGDSVRYLWAESLSGDPGLEGYLPSNPQFPYIPFIDADYKSGDFLAGLIGISNMPNMEKAEKYIILIPDAEVNSLGMAKSHRSSIPRDYSGEESYYAAYIMPTFKVGQNLTFIPGFRYEHNETDYSGWGVTTAGLETVTFPLDTLRTVRENDFYLPMVSLKWQLTESIDIRAAYTQTVSRPSYNNFVPYYQANFSAPNVFNNPNLKPIESTNIDLGFSIYTNKIGLFSVNGFYKEIKNFIYGTTTTIIDSSMLLPIYPEFFAPGMPIRSYVNNSNIAEVYGVEIDWQSNSWFLPGAWSGIVFGINYTYTQSETKYPKFEAIVERVGIRQVTTGNREISFKDRLVDQPDHILNVMLGFDFGGFSLRASAKYKSSVYISENFYPELRQDTEGITFYDLSIVQKLPLEGLRIYMNASNLSDEKDFNTNQGTGWFSRIDYYSRSAVLGIRYDLN